MSHGQTPARPRVRRACPDHNLALPGTLAGVFPERGSPVGRGARCDLGTGWCGIEKDYRGATATAFGLFGTHVATRAELDSRAVGGHSFGFGRPSGGTT